MVDKKTWCLLLALCQTFYLAVSSFEALILSDIWREFQSFLCSRAMCLIDFGMPVDRDESELVNGQDTAPRNLQSTPIKGRLKRILRDGQTETKLGVRKNFEFFSFRNPVLFIGHLSKNSLLIIDKPWLEVVKTFSTSPVHRHIFGTWLL